MTFEGGARGDPETQRLPSPRHGAGRWPESFLPRLYQLVLQYQHPRRHRTATSVLPLGSFLPSDFPHVHLRPCSSCPGHEQGGGGLWYPLVPLLCHHLPARCHPQGSDALGSRQGILGLEVVEAFEQFLVGDVARSSSQNL